MKGKRYTEEQIIGILKEHEAGIRHRMSFVSTASPTVHCIAGNPSLVAWRSRRRSATRARGRRTARLKKLLAETMLDKTALEDVLQNMYGPLPVCNS